MVDKIDIILIDNQNENNTYAADRIAMIHCKPNPNNNTVSTSCKICPLAINIVNTILASTKNKIMGTSSKMGFILSWKLIKTIYP